MYYNTLYLCFSEWVHVKNHLKVLVVINIQLKKQKIKSKFHTSSYCGCRIQLVSHPGVSPTKHCDSVNMRVKHLLSRPRHFGPKNQDCQMKETI